MSKVQMMTNVNENEIRDSIFFVIMFAQQNVHQNVLDARVKPEM